MQVEWKALQQMPAASLANVFFGGAKRVQLLRDMCSRVLVACCHFSHRCLPETKLQRLCNKRLAC